jgi:hypothetical protein
MSTVSPRAVLARVAAAVPQAVLDNIVIVGSLAAGYHLLGESTDAQVQTKDVDCLLLPRVAAASAAAQVAHDLLAAGWRPRTEGAHAKPGDEQTPDGALPAVRLWPPDSTEWFLELLAADGHFGLPSYRYLDVATHDAPMTESGLRCARPSLLALSNLLRNPEIRPETMEALVEGRKMRRSNKDLGRVIAIARLSGADGAREWPGVWTEALRACHGDAWRSLAGRTGSGLRALLASPSDLEEARITSNGGLLAIRPLTFDQYRLEVERVLVDAIEPTEELARRAGG